MRRWKKWLLRVTLLLAVVAGYFGYRYWRYTVGTERLGVAIAALDRDDPEWRMEQIQAARAKRFPPDDRNIAKLGIKISNDTPVEFDEFLRSANELWVSEMDFNRLPPVQKLDEARRVRTLCLDVIERSLKLGDLTDGGMISPPQPNPFDTSLEHVQRLRIACGLLKHNAIVLASDNKPDKAFASGRAAFRIPRGINDEPALVAVLARIAICLVAVETTERTLAYGIPTAGLAEFQDELLRESDAPLLAIAFRGDRAFLHSAFEYLESQKTLFRTSGYDSALERVYHFAFSNMLVEDHGIGLGLMNRYLEISQGPSHEWVRRMKSCAVPGRESHVLWVLLPAYEKVASAVLRATARFRTLAVGIACERFRQANGRWPKDLAEIPKSILSAIPRDPYIDAPLNYRITDEGITIYAVGDDLTDDRGKLTYSNKPKIGEDVGARLWSPKFRRLEPLPKAEAE